MTSKATVNDFLASKNLALIGMSRDPKKFGNYIYKTLESKGYNVFPIHRETDSIEGEKCYPSFADLPVKVDGAVFCIKPEDTDKMLKEAESAGINKFWFQQGSTSPKTLLYCKEKGLNFVNGECIVMFTEGDKMPHVIHKWVWKIIGKMPK